MNDDEAEERGEAWPKGDNLRVARQPPRIVGKHSWNYLFAPIIVNSEQRGMTVS